MCILCDVGESNYGGVKSAAVKSGCVKTRAWGHAPGCMCYVCMTWRLAEADLRYMARHPGGRGSLFDLLPPPPRGNRGGE